MTHEEDILRLRPLTGKELHDLLEGIVATNPYHGFSAQLAMLCDQARIPRSEAIDRLDEYLTSIGATP